MLVSPLRTLLAAALLVVLTFPLAGCAGWALTPQTPTSPQSKRPEDAPVTQNDRRIILALASDSLEYERASAFSDVRSDPVTADEIATARLGDVDRGFLIIPSELPSEGTIFSATRVANENWVSVPIILGERYLAELGFERIDGRWEPGSIGCEAPHHDRARAEVNRAISGTLGGSPEETRSVNVDGSLWVVGKRGSREAAGFIAVLAYGCFGDSSVRLPTPGTVLTGDEFRTLLGKMKSPQ